MIVPRLLALGALAYAGLRLRDKLRRAPAPARRAAGDAEPVRDVLMEDPVCRRLVPSGQALTLEAAGNTHYFCSEECRRAFQRQGERSA